MVSTRILLVAVLMSALSACASSPDFRDLASNTGQIVQTLNTGTADFASAQTEMNGQNAARLRRLQILTDRNLLEARRQQLAWAAVPASRPVFATAYEDAIALTPEQMVASLGQRYPSPPAVTASSKADLDASQEALVILSKEPSAAASLANLLEFAGAIQTTLDDLKAKATVESAAAAEAPRSLETTPAPVRADPGQ